MSEKFGPLTEKIQNKVGFSDEKALKLEEGLCSSTDMVTQAMVQLVAKMDGEMIVHNDLKERFAALLSVLDIQALLIEANLTSNPDQGFIHLKKLRTIISKMSDLLVHSKNLGPLTLEKNVFNLQSLFRQVITTTQLLEYKKDNQEILKKSKKFNIPDLEWKGDFVKLIEAFTNLLYFLLKIEQVGEVVLTAIENKTHITIYIDHIGCGIDEEQAEMLFELSSQPTTATNRQGTGLLLVASYNTITHHQGTVDFNNENDRCGFVITLPRS